MKRFLLLCVLTLNIMACDEGIKLLSSTKQTIVQGTHMTKPYTNYLFEITLLNAIDLRVDSVLIYDHRKAYKVNHYLSKRKNNKNYILTAALNEGNYTSSDAETDIEEAIIYYQVNEKSGVLNITTFKEETVTRR
ncbi:hypothetical protein [Kordia jejudonensis]|uniref:hypothetical protein n=1 Tax=Kordia jejudonensis TaxID=1348245 RepID=UPI000629B1D0|nr:hypothetical protein [Kordia jejudonensis]